VTRRLLISSDEATPATRQHQRPCSDCPWRRDSLAGWLGVMSPREWLSAAHGDGTIECHVHPGAQCAGAAIYRANVAKLPRLLSALRLPADRRRVFGAPAEFLEHHGQLPSL
jgi:hypothetical protein